MKELLTATKTALTRRESAILEARSHLRSLGITGWQDARVPLRTLEAYRSLALGGRLTARVVAALRWDRHCELEQLDSLRTQREQGPRKGSTPRASRS